jgi:Undecaprenyl-phosphate galactose phosphotransferase WbaP
MLRNEAFAVVKGAPLYLFGSEPLPRPRASIREALVWSRPVQSCILLLSDLIALLSAYVLSWLLWAHWILNQPPAPYLQLAPLLLLVTLVYVGAGLYPGFGLGAVETIRRIFKCTSLAFLGLGALSFMLKEQSQFSRMTYALTWGLALLGVPLLRFLLLSRVHALRWWGQPSLIVGTREQVRMTIQSLQRAFSLGYRVVGFISIDDAPAAGAIEGIVQLGGLEMAPEVAEMGIGTVLVWDSAELVKIVDALQDHFRTVVVVRDERVIPIEHIRVRNLGGVLGIEFTNQLLRRGNQVIKRMLDEIAALLLLVPAAPLIGLGALAVKLASPGPAFYRQRRRGLRERPFTVWKLRTMYPDAERRLQECLRDPELRREWETTMKLSRDPRIIPVVGHLLRRLSIDELPQLWSVLRGDMSLVGPRPFPDYHLDMFPADFRRFRARIRPGITGMWQVMIRSSGNLDHQEMFDTYYIRNWSLWLDLYILARTVFAVLSASGAS